MKLIFVKNPVTFNFKERLSNFSLPKFNFNRNYAFAFVTFILLASIVTAASLFLFSSKTDFTISPSIIVIENLPDTVSAVAGDYYSYTANITNDANTQHNFTILYWINSSTIVLNSGDVMVRILDSDNSTVLLSSSTVQNNAIGIEIKDISIASNTNKLLNPTVEFRPSSAPGVYNLNFQVVEGSYNFRS